MLEYYVSALQESYRASHGRFADNYSSLFAPGTRITSAALAHAKAGFTIRLNAGDSSGWSAAASRADLPGAVCVLNVGAPSSSLAVPAHPARLGEPGEVVCAGFSN